MRTKSCLTLDDARALVAGAQAEARKQGWAVSVAVVDDAGFVVALERMDGAPLKSADVAVDKARTSAWARAATKALEDVVAQRPATGTFQGRLPVQGGLPIVVGSEHVGAIGVSGVKSPEDEQVASAGLQAFLATVQK